MGAIWASRDGASKLHGAGHKIFKLSFDIRCGQRNNIHGAFGIFQDGEAKHDATSVRAADGQVW